VIASLYALSTLLTLKGARGGAVRRAQPAAGRASPLADLRAGVAYVWTTPLLLASMCLAFLLNCTSFPMMHGLMPVMAKEIYRIDQTGLGYLVAVGGFGALTGAVIMSRIGHTVRPARMVLFFSAGWLLSLMCFVNTTNPAMGMPFLLLAGLSQGLSQISMSTLLIRHCDEQFRGRMMGLRMLAIYGNIPGLLLAGWLIPRIGYPLMATLYGAAGLAFVVLIAVRWRKQLWQRGAAANNRT
jgi:predicted MFS family arabinose efflux permease